MAGATSSLGILNRVLGRKAKSAESGEPASWNHSNQSALAVDPAWTTFESHPALASLRIIQKAAQALGIGDPFFKVHEGMGGAKTRINGKDYLNFSHYNYLGLNGHPEINQDARDAVDRYGTSAGASRLVAGERPIQRELEQELAKVYGAEDCVVFVSGHATNVSTIATLFGPKDLVLHDAQIHNSILEGIRLSGATRRSFPHNDLAALDELLGSLRSRFERVLIVVEGLYSMDGDIPDLPHLVDLKRKYGTFLMVDEAHSLGVLGASGKGIAEHYALSPSEVDIWMGTLSKTLVSCGGYIAGSKALVDILKSAAPGFVYSVGLSPVLAAASLTALRIMLREPERTRRLKTNTDFFLSSAQEAGLNTGTAQGYAIVPVLVGSSRKAVQLSNTLFEHGVNVQPIIHPAVEERAARLRFFLSCEHEKEDLQHVVELLASYLGATETPKRNTFR